MRRLCALGFVVALVALVAVPGSALAIQVNQSSLLFASDGTIAEGCQHEMKTVRRDYHQGYRVIKVRGVTECDLPTRVVASVTDPSAYRDSQYAYLASDSDAWRFVLVCNWRVEGRWYYQPGIVHVYSQGSVELSDGRSATGDTGIEAPWRC
jgi:hypothetical protein